MKIPPFKTIILVVLAAAVLAGYGAVSKRLNNPGVDIKPKSEALKQQLPTGKMTNIKKATLNPGRVVQLYTNKGLIEFVLFEKDCPNTTKRIANLVSKGAYNGVKFWRVDKNKLGKGELIQTSDAKVKVQPMGCEFRSSMTHAKGSVGMARGRDTNSNTSQFYILLEPRPALDLEYTNFGRLINGMDAAMKMEVGDVIRKATLRKLTDKDKKRFYEILQIESERRTDS